MKNNVTIIAEAGVNHNGDIELAKDLIDAAARSGSDYVKFQTYKTEEIVTNFAEKADYQKKNSPESSEGNQFGMLKRLEINDEWYPSLISYCELRDIGFLSTAFDIKSINLLNTLNIDFYKIPSGEITNKPYLKRIAKFGKDIVLSTGMSTILEIKEAISIFNQEGINNDKLTVLHCNTEYPTPFGDVNLLAMNHIKEELKVKVGYSDHTLGVEIPIAAVALGASIIEKHFTLDRDLDGPDHSASLEPNELKAMVEGIRNVESAISGSGIKEVSKSEKKNLNHVRKSLHFARNINQPHIIEMRDLSCLRPGNGISPMRIDDFIGKKLNKNVVLGEKVDESHFD